MEKLHHSDHALKNRAFNCRMRNRYYEEVYYAFRTLVPSSDLTNETFRSQWIEVLDKNIHNYERLVTTCLEYAQASISNGKLEASTLYSKDKRWGVLQEEIFLVYFLQELLSTIRYVIARLETDNMLRKLSGSMQDKMTKPMGSGFVNNIQEKLNALNGATIEEFKDLTKHVMERFQIGNTLFGTIQELQNFY